MKIALVIGGSGMLAGLTKMLSKDFGIVGVLARNKDKLSAVSAYSGNIVPITCDYSNLKKLKDQLDEFISTYGSPELIVSWVHSTSPDVAVMIAEYCTDDFYEVTGQSGSEADHISRRHEKYINKLDINYHRVVLGHIGQRWLTNDEISAGVIAATLAKKPEYIVGNI